MPLGEKKGEQNNVCQNSIKEVILTDKEVQRLAKEKDQRLAPAYRGGTRVREGL